ncbi:uncharacterized protein K02A2.6-like [Armigeres subalbatus]|uniref:uncharacterized protein K02A2.6-like n=1 Tax=Armigeres subalbatus TaxID=124917 RepID=UPI002ED2E02A
MATAAGAGAPPPNFAIDPFDRKKLKWMRKVCCCETYDVVCDKIAPATPRNKTYAEIVNLLKGFFNPQPLEISENFRFKCRRQGDKDAAPPDETVDEYLVTLRRIAFTCNFGAYLETALRNHTGKPCDKTKEETSGGDDDRGSAPVREVCNVDARSGSARFLLNVLVNGKNIRFELDTGSPIIIVSAKCKDRYFSGLRLRDCSTNIVSYCGTSIEALGIIDTRVEYGGEKVTLPLYVVQSEKHPLLGCEWLNTIPVDWNTVFHNRGAISAISNAAPSCTAALKQILERFPKVFDDSIGKICSVQVSLPLKKNARAMFLKARKIPFNLQKTVEDELDKLEAEGVLTKVNQSNWATSIVPVKKSQGRVRICGDYKQTVNPNLLVDRHPLTTYGG